MVGGGGADVWAYLMDPSVFLTLQPEYGGVVTSQDGKRHREGGSLVGGVGFGLVWERYDGYDINTFVHLRN